MTLDELLAAVQAGKMSPQDAERALSPGLSPGTDSDANVTNSIAIIGLAGRYPGADSPDELWQRLASGDDLITEVPAERWAVDGFYEPDRERAAVAGKSYCKWGGFMRDSSAADRDFFAAIPRSLELTEPGELSFARLLGQLLDHSDRSRDVRARGSADVGLYLGARANGVPGVPPVVIANRISSFFNLEGPSISIDAMSASSMAALHLACQALLAGECRMAIAAGLSVLSRDSYVRMSGLGIFADHPGVRSFSRGRGMLPCEAMAAVLLKRLDHALRDDDRIHAVIRGTVFANAATFSQTAPPRERLISRLLAKASIDPRRIGYVETSAAGDALADAVEIAALTSAFRPFGIEPGSCPVGSVKSNLGHALAASGMTQLTKVILQLEHQQLAPSIKADADFSGTPFRLQRQLSQWCHAPHQPLRALLNSFGGGGSMGCVIVEAAPLRSATLHRRKMNSHA